MSAESVPLRAPWQGPLHRVAYVLSAAPLFWIAWRLLQVWVAPEAVPRAESWVRFGLALMLLEFVLLHSGVFVAVTFSSAQSWRQRVLVLLGLTLFYGIFALGFALGTASRVVLEIYGLVMLGRFATLVVDQGAGTATLLARSVLGTLVYLPVVFASIFLPWPRLGISSALAEAARTANSSGIWVDEPHRVIAAGALYFAVMGVLEVRLAFADPERAKGLALARRVPR